MGRSPGWLRGADVPRSVVRGRGGWAERFADVLTEVRGLLGTAEPMLERDDVLGRRPPAACTCGGRGLNSSSSARYPPCTAAGTSAGSSPISRPTTCPGSRRAYASTSSADPSAAMSFTRLCAHCRAYGSRAATRARRTVRGSARPGVACDRRRQW